MDEVINGLFLMEEFMPCSPRKIRIGHYFIPSTLGRGEREEAAARIISFSQQLDQWVGVSWPQIVDMMMRDYVKHQFSEAKLVLHNKCMEVWFKQLNRRFWLCIVTLGIYALFVPKPERPTNEQEQSDTPFSGIYLFGPQHVVTGIQELIEQNMLEKVTKGRGEDAVEVFFPTPKLISRIMEMQGVTA